MRETFTKQYWLHEIYPVEVREAHQSGDAHIHDLGFFWSLLCWLGFTTIINRWFGGVKWQGRK